MIDRIKSNWDEITSFIKSENELTEVSFNTWILPLKPINIKKDSEGTQILDVIVPDKLFKSYVGKRYSLFIEFAIEEKTGIKCHINLVTEDELKNPGKSDNLILDKGKIDFKSDSYEKSNLDPNYTFDSFVVGKNNNIAHAAALAVAETPGEIYNPLFIYGGVGLGKTHLMEAIAHFILEKDPDKKVLYVPSETFTNELIESIKNNTTLQFRNKYRNNDVLLIDDIQFIIGKDRTQEEFFHTFNAMYQAKKQIIMTSDRPPKDFDTLEDRIKSRFEWGLTVDIQSPDYETRMAILRKKEEREGFNVDNEVIKYIASNIKSNIRELEGALNKVMAMSNLDHREVNVALAEEVLKDIVHPDSPLVITGDSIIEMVCEKYGVTREDLESSKRNKELVRPRHVSMYLIRTMTNSSLDQIGKYLGGRDHTTIMHGIDKIESDLKTDLELQNAVNNIKKKISPQ